MWKINHCIDVVSSRDIEVLEMLEESKQCNHCAYNDTP